jgi:hypothetical protein
LLSCASFTSQCKFSLITDARGAPNIAWHLWPKKAVQGENRYMNIISITI